MYRFCDCPQTDNKHSFTCPMAGNNQPRSLVKATIFRNAFVGNIEEVEGMVTLDRYGVHATWEVNGVREPLRRLCESNYHFDAPDTVCPITAKSNYLRADGSVVYPNYPYDAYRVEA